MVVGTVIGMVGVTVWMIDNPPNGPKITRTGYFKSSDSDRVIAYESDRALTLEEAEEFFATVLVTDGRFSRVLIYNGAALPAPAFDLDSAMNLLAAMTLTANPPHDDWSWRLHQNAAGERVIDSQ